MSIYSGDEYFEDEVTSGPIINENDSRAEEVTPLEERDVEDAAPEEPVEDDSDEDGDDSDGDDSDDADEEIEE